MTMNLHTNLTAGVAPVTTIEPSSLEQGISPTGGAGTLLPEPSLMLLGDAGAEIAAIAVQQGEAQQTIDTTAAEAEDTSADAAAAAQVATLHQEASTTRAGALESGVLQISAGACAIASAGVAADAKVPSTTPGAAAVSPNTTWSGVLKGASEGLMGGGTMADGLSRAAATDSQALATGQQAAATSAQQAAAAARDGQKSAESFVQAALDFYKEYETTKAQAQAAALHGA
jgi:hypothetical protein